MLAKRRGMDTISNLALPWRNLRRHGLAYGLTGLLIGAAMFYPSDLTRDYSICRSEHYSTVVQGTEKYLRHVNAMLPIATIVVLRDWRGAGQLAGVVVAGIAASHGPKRLLNDVTIMGTRLGQRPSGPSVAAQYAVWALYSRQRWGLLYGPPLQSVVFVVLPAGNWAHDVCSRDARSAYAVGGFCGRYDWCGGRLALHG